MNTRRLRELHRALDGAKAFQLGKIIAKAEAVFAVDPESLQAANELIEVHSRRLKGDGSPAECDAVAKRILG